MTTVIVQKWEERERGWGSRPDGYSIHLTEDDRRKFIQAYWAKTPADAPDDYSRPLGTPYEADVDVSQEDMISLMDQAGVWVFNDNYPGSGGIDGWIKTGANSFGLRA
jgi:hypothetical protein